MPYTMQGDTLAFTLEDRIDSNNVHIAQDQIDTALSETGAAKIQLDASNLTYISSAGLRMVMRIARRGIEVSVVEASPAVYDVFDITGFVQLFNVQKRLREISIDGLQQIGAGANGRVYRLNAEQVLKVYNPITNPPERLPARRMLPAWRLSLVFPPLSRLTWLGLATALASCTSS